ncbi:hypothetical protein FN846DRAFT_37919 [Sphaerosporella brunnea]|uniref:Fe2OG dioxygenase domain-containing protein n=1 Tax=Sphaerosporella brunnea TaxID=1250544 RepID=A0A5J5F938_9PEZI|nr:hypothetical protein FN846DRAFT_37919 [Sphaerosporella brunnea]
MDIDNSVEEPQRKMNFRLDELDPRILRDVLVPGLDGNWLMPKGCKSCLEQRKFCDRGSPCASCLAAKRNCVRNPGQQVAKPTQPRPAMRSINFNPTASKRSNNAVANAEPENDPDVEVNVTATVAHPVDAVKKRVGRPPKKIKTEEDVSTEAKPVVTQVVAQNVNATVAHPVDAVKKRVGRPPKKIKTEEDASTEAKPVVTQVVAQTKIARPLPSSWNDSKPEGIGRPEIWCETRQELCETLPYYRAFQSGCYCHGGVVRGYLLDGTDSPRDFLNGKVFVSHCGGKSEEDAATGARKLRDNQTVQDLNVKSLLNNIRNRFPVAVIIGDRNKIAPSKIPHRYCVLDWFKVTHAWAEKCPISGYSRWKFRFEKFDFSADGWWASKRNSGPTTECEISYASCKSCKGSWANIYQEGWMCMNPACPQWWKIDGIQQPEGSLTYTVEFQHAETVWPLEEIVPNDLRPVLNLDWDYMFQSVKRRAWKGFCCPMCGRLSCRIYWDHLECANADCGFAVVPERRIAFRPEDLADPHAVTFKGPALPFDWWGSEIATFKTLLDGYTVIQYALPDCGQVTHMLANQPINARQFGADWLLREYQSAAMPFMRHTMHTMQGVTRTSHFTYNVGAQYNYVTEQPTVAFSEAPEVVTKALDLIKKNVQLIYPGGVEFNEVLNVGYIEDQKMGFHQDGEKGLGPTVASISLGCSAKMTFRKKVSKKNCSAPAEPVESQDDKKRVRLELHLNHGDIMIMHGAKIQQVWEHAAVPTGLFRIAATARMIDNGSIITKETEVKKEPIGEPQEHMLVQEEPMDLLEPPSAHDDQEPMAHETMAVQESMMDISN